MLEEKLPKLKYNLLDYPNLEERADGMCIPLLWGTKENITPVCIDTTIFEFKIMQREIKSIDAVRADGVINSDYSEDLVNAEFTFLNAPYLSAATLYYLVFEGTYAIGANYAGAKGTWTNEYAGGMWFSINEFDAWNPSANYDMYFEIWGKDTLDSAEQLKINFPIDPAHMTFTPWNLRDVLSRTRIAQSFTTGAAGFYVTKARFFHHIVGNPSGNVRFTILSAYNPAEVQVGAKSAWKNVWDLIQSWTAYLTWQPINPEKSKISVDASGAPNPDTTLMMNVADILQDIYVNLLGGDSADLNAADFAALKAARTEELAIWLDKETSFGEIKECLEAGQLFKFLQNIAGEFTVRYYAAGEPGGTPHYQDEDFISFEAKRSLSSVYQKVKVKYDEDPSTQEWKVEEEMSEIARFFYRSNKTLEIETYLKNSADAFQLAEDYLGTDAGSSRKVHLQYPQRTIKFELQVGLGFDLIPTQKVKITRTRGDYSGGLYNAVLFRILEIEKKYNTQTVEITAALDSLTY